MGSYFGAFAKKNAANAVNRMLGIHAANPGLMPLFSPKAKAILANKI